MSPVDVEKLSDAEIDAMLKLIEHLVGNQALSDDDLALLSDLSEEISNHATELSDKVLNAQNAGIKALIEKFGTKKDALKKAHDDLVAATQAFNQFAQAITAFNKLIPVLTK